MLFLDKSLPKPSNKHQSTFKSEHLKPYTLTYYSWGARYKERFTSPQEAIDEGNSIAESGNGSPKIVSCGSRRIHQF
jgi:hypothetical protein